MKTKNIVEARGKIVRIKNGGHGYGVITLLVKVNVKESTVTFTLAEPLNPDIAIGNVVDIKGHIRTSGTYTDDNGKKRSDQYFIADKIRPAKSRLELMCGIKGHHTPEHFFRCCIVGAFVNFHKSGEDWGRIYIATATDTNVSNTIMANYYLKGRLLGPNKFMRGDEVALVADVNTSTKEYDGEKRRFENIYVEDIVIINKGDGETLPVLEK